VSTYVSASAELERYVGTEAELQLGPDAMTELAAVITPERLPHLAPMFLRGEYIGGPPQEDTAADNPVAFEFRWGLDRLLDGLAQLHESRNIDETPP
jgi:hypothetical protein